MNLEKMPLGKRGYSGLSYNARYKRARTQGRAYKGMVNVLTRGPGKKVRSQRVNKLVISKVNNLYRMIENKHFTWRTSPNLGLAHNRVTTLQLQSGGNLNPFRSVNGTDDPMGTGGSRVGDMIKCTGLLIRGMFENALNRPKVHYRVMLVKCAKGDTLDDTTFMQAITGNKLIDQINTERFTIVAQKMFTITVQGSGAPTSVSATGEPSGDEDTRGGIGTKTFKMWIPGSKFGPDGRVHFENNSQGQVKFFDYRVVVIVYDWYGTPTGGGLIPNNDVGKVNELYTKLYFKDA